MKQHRRKKKERWVQETLFEKGYCHCWKAVLEHHYHWAAKGPQKTTEMGDLRQEGH